MSSNLRFSACILLGVGVLLCGQGFAQDAKDAGSFSGLGMNMGNLSRLSNAQTRSICPENFTGEKGKAGAATTGTGANASRELGRGWKVSPSIPIEAGKTATLADIDGPGAIQQIWMTPTGDWRMSILLSRTRKPSSTRNSARPTPGCTR